MSASPRLYLGGLLRTFKPYLSSLILYRKHPPTRMGRIDWRSVYDACGLEDEMTPALKRGLRSGLEAVIRWIDQERPIEHDHPAPTPLIQRAPQHDTRTHNKGAQPFGYPQADRIL